MKKILIVLIGLIVFAEAQPAKAMTGQLYLKVCKKSVESDFQNSIKEQPTAICQAYTAGIRESVNVLLCPFNKGIKTDQLIAIAYYHIKKNPEKWHFQPSLQIIKAWQDVFPCPKK